MRCTYCGSGLHPYEYCPKTWGGSAARLHLRCSYCGGRNHDYEGCPKLNGRYNSDGVVLLDKRP
ncbi:hypothetical protein QE408_002560 [Agrobacterium larrymoorei]|uniref:Nanos-type domain-containing protein n=1 Tax=Agrobacterium larrymoorei TaxID=160699 RepID=A0ABU0UKC8_9HYPH|nr:hypothetical protein [Agrobacterium larrymoorei]